MPADSYERMDSSESGAASGSGSESQNQSTIKSSSLSNSNSNSSIQLSSSPSATSILNNVRLRTESENADNEPKFILPGTDTSPAKILTLDEVANIVKNVENMALAHEIAVNPDFKLQRYEPPENSLSKKIKDVVHQAFWDVLKEQLNREPPCFDHAIQLLSDIKESFSHIVLKNNQKLLTRINEVLDEELIRQQAIKGVLIFKDYIDFIVDILSKICAPIRDADVQKLYGLTDVVDTFRQILELMSIMKLDMANCILDAARIEFIANSVEYEKKRFQEYLTVYTYGFTITENWLHRNAPDDKTVPHWQNTTIINAYMEFLNWKDNENFPEILTIDKDRLLALSASAFRLCICATVIAIASGIPAIGQHTENKRKLISQIQILLENVKNQKDLEGIIENIWLQVHSFITKELKEVDENSQSITTLKQQILTVAEPDSTVKSLMWKRLIAYIRLLKTSKPNASLTIPPPPGYTDYTNQINSLSSTFNRLTTYNYSVYGEYYHKILENDIHSVEHLEQA